MRTMLKFAALFAFGLSCGWLSAQSLYVYPATVTAPRGSYQTCTAVVTGTNNKTVTWTTTGGTLVGTNPGTANEPNTIALYTTTAGTYTVTATTNVGAVTGTCVVTMTASPTAVSTHPRLIVTSGMLAGLQAKAVSTNPIYQNFLTFVNSYYYTPDSAIWTFSTWSGSACTGGSGPSSSQVNHTREVDANMFAWLSMVAPTSALRNQYGCAARDVWTYVMTNVDNGSETIVGNRWSDNSQYFTLTTDWLMAGGYLGSSDLTLARTYSAYILKTILNYGYGISTPAFGASTGYNSSSVFLTVAPSSSGSDLQNMRTMGNNYTMSKMLYLTALSLTFNDTTPDDPPLTNTCSATRYQVCPDFTAGSLHAYFTYLAGSMLYADFAHLEDPNVSWKAYQAAYSNLPTQPQCQYVSGVYYPCFGDGRGGESSEGSWYQYSIYRLRYAMNILHTAGYDDPMLYGPQISLGTSSWWDMKYMSDLSFLTSYNASNGLTLGASQPSFNFFTTGDSNNYMRKISDFNAESALMTFDTYTGRTDRTNALEWGVVNSAPGMLAGTGCTGSYCGFDNNIGNFNASGVGMYDTFIAMPATDPVSSPPSDPRSSFPTDLYNGSQNQHQMVRNNWTQGSNTVLSAYCDTGFINHEHTNCGRFDVLANGEYITKGATIFDDYNSQVVTSPESNQQSLANTTGSGCSIASCTTSALYGGEWDNALEAGLGTVKHSELPVYSSFLVEDAGLYNGWWVYNSPYDVPSYNDVTAASRSMVYLRGTNQVAYYDRSVTGHAATKSTNLIVTGTPTIVGNTGYWLTRSTSQKAYLTALLPSGGTLSNIALICSGSGGPSPCYAANQQYDWEPSTTLNMAASGTPTSTQFLSVMEWGASSLTKSTTTLVQSSSGQNFDGSLIGLSVVMFMRSPTTFTGTVYPASGGTTHYISDLTPNTSYSVAGAGTPGGGVLTDTAGVLTFEATGTGNITIGTASPTTPQVVFSGTDSISGSVVSQ